MESAVVRVGEGIIVNSIVNPRRIRRKPGGLYGAQVRHPVPAADYRTACGVHTAYVVD